MLAVLRQESSKSQYEEFAMGQKAPVVNEIEPIRIQDLIMFNEE